MSRALYSMLGRAVALAAMPQARKTIRRQGSAGNLQVLFGFLYHNDFPGCAIGTKPRLCELPRDKAFPAGLRSLVARPTVQRVWLLFLVADASSFLHQYETSRLIKAPGEHVALECPNKELIKFALSNL
jgi:hypothetical protein